MNTPTLHASPLNPRSFQELMRFAEIAAGSGMVPREYAGKAAAIVIACQMGAELGLAPMQSLQNIAVINGRPSVWGDTLLALVRSSPVCDDVVEHIEGDGDALTAVCVATRKGKKPVEARFSYADARTAGLLNKTGPWKTYPRRMLQMRARGFALRDAFPDVLRGLITAEEAQDIPVDDATPTQPISHKERTPSLSEAGKKRVEDGANALIERVMGVSTRGELEAITSEDAVKKQRVFLRQRMPELADRVDQVVSETLDGIERHAQNERQDEPPAATMEEMPA
ncbi:hypothetical protein GS535_05100 [Saccharibacter sp. EH611]|nr:hypothetical protein [Saccharibacter sp. EH611]MXV58054.1 hypothetical protein [Saccharibacter sp. EH70]MXV66291.1 hypothetical protein [Saccharibacter sp. EH60]